MNNAVYGNTMENLRNRIDVKLVNNKKDYLNWRSKPSYISSKIFDSDLVAICINKVKLRFNKTGYISILIYFSADPRVHLGIPFTHVTVNSD